MTTSESPRSSKEQPAQKPEQNKPSRGTAPQPAQMGKASHTAHKAAPRAAASGKNGAGASPAQGSQNSPSSTASSPQAQETARAAVEEAATVRLNPVDLKRIEDTGTMALKGITAAAPRITTSAITKEEREARRKAREAAKLSLIHI